MTPNKFLKGRSGIYGIRNVSNGKIYVGRTICMYRRCHQYVYDFHNRSIGHLNDYLYRAITKYGMENFEFFPLEFGQPDTLPSLELEWMMKLGSTDRKKGYNLRMDSEGVMITSPETSMKIRENLLRQWAEGTRDEHSGKLKAVWARNPERRVAQGELFSKIKTKYSYHVTHPSGECETCDFKRLSELGIKNVLANFHRKNSDTVTCKGYTVSRSLLTGDSHG